MNSRTVGDFAGLAADQGRSPSTFVATHAGARFFCSLMEEHYRGALRDARVLVAGCGHGREAAYLHDRLEAQVDAVDVWLDRGVDLPTRERLCFTECDVLRLPFDDATFDAVFYHHVIEHVSDPVASVKELARVLRPSGWFFIGTPNRHRIIGNVGAYERSIGHKLRQNIRDWKMRLQGRFRNELGAHAGFARAELDAILSPYFNERRWVTREYLASKYATGMRGQVARVATAGPWMDVVVPSIYALCCKGV